MRKPLVIANWKQNGNSELFAATAETIAAETRRLVDIGVCPPFVYLAQGRDILGIEGIAIGAQNCSKYYNGAYTGEVGAAMLADSGVSLVLAGHSERRSLFSESDEVINTKLKQIQRAGLIPVLCVGETLTQRESGQVGNVIRLQLEVACEGIDFENLVVAYEPVWAIGTGKTATPTQAQEVHKMIRDWFASQHGSVANKLRILYGGSMKPENAAELLNQPDIDGGLIGGASLKPEQFNAICRAAQDS